MKRRPSFAPFALVLLTIAGVFMLLLPYGQAPQCDDICYVNATSGADANSGAEPEQAKRSIQAAIDAVQPGGEVVVAAGEYVEQLFVEKNVIIRGETADETRLLAPAALLDSPPVPSNVNRVISILTVRGGADVNVSGLSVVGPLAAASCDEDVTGIYVHQNAHLALQDAVVQDIYPRSDAADLSTCQTGLGIRVGEFGGDTAGRATISDVRVDGFQKTGIVISSTGTQATIDSSSISGAGENPNLAQNGIQVSANALATITNNTISDLQCGHRSCGSDPTNQFASSGIIIFGGGTGNAIENNVITNNDMGIYNLSNGTSISQNTLEDNRYAGILLDEGWATIDENTIAGGGFGVLAVTFNADLYNILGNTEAIITRNIITGAETAIGLLDENEADIVVPQVSASFNVISGNETGFDNPTENVMDLSCNYWGSADGPSGVAAGNGDAVTANGNFLPWLTSENLDVPCERGQNVSPDAQDDTTQTTSGTPVVIALLSNDTDPDGDFLGVTPGEPDHGSVTVNPDGTVTYTPSPFYDGTDRFEYSASDGKGGFDTATVLIVVQPPPNTPPDAVDDSFETPYETPITIEVLGNDSDADANTLTVVEVGSPANGALASSAEGTYLYTPNPGFTGKDTFNYTISDGKGGSDSAIVSIEVLPPPNNPPNAVADVAEVVTGSSVTIGVLMNDTDADGDVLGLTSATDPQHGSITTNDDGSITYTPEVGYTGEDTFSYSIGDGRGGAANAAVTITVVQVPNAAPTADDDSASTIETTPIIVAVLENDSDPDDDPLTVSLPDQPANGTAVVNTDGTITYTAQAGFAGVESFTYTINDGQGGSDAAIIRIEVVPAPNVPPDAADDSAETTSGIAVTIRVLDNDSDPDGDPLSVISITSPGSGSARRIEDGGITYTPAGDFIGTDSFTYDIGDGNGGSDTATVTIEVLAPPNAVPVAFDDTASTTENTPVDIDVLANDSDPDDDPLTITEVTPPLNGTVTQGENGLLTYTPNPIFTGPDTFSYTIADGVAGTDSALVVVIVSQAANAAPVAQDDNAETLADTPVTVNVLANDSDGDGDPLTIATVTEPDNGAVTVNDDGSLTYVPAVGFVGQDSLTYTVTDGKGGSATASVTFVVAARPNTEPLAVDDSVTTNVNTPVRIVVLANDSDADGDVLSISETGSPANGTATLVQNALLYQPAQDFTGDDSLTYTVTDGNGGSSTATVFVNVSAPTNQPPVAVGDLRSTTINTSVNIPVLANDSDPDGDIITLATITQPGNGLAVANVDGTVSYSPAVDFTGQDSFTYAIDDGADGTATATVTIEVLPAPNINPTAVDDVMFADAAATSIVNVIANDSDADGDSFVVSEVGDPAHGTATNLGDGTIAYAPDDGYFGPDSFAYTILDARGGSATGTVRVEIASPEPLGGNLAITKIVNWAAIEPNANQTFKLCLTGPSYPEFFTEASCQIVNGLGGVVTWTGLLPGTYEVKEVDPGEPWKFQNSGIVVEVYDNATSHGIMTNFFAYVYEAPMPSCPVNTEPILTFDEFTLDAASEAIGQFMGLRGPVLITIEVASMVGRPDLGCPFSGNSQCQLEDNEEFYVLVDDGRIELIPDHGDNQWQLFSVSGGVLFEGSHEISFEHSGRLGSKGEAGSVTIRAVACAGTAPRNIRGAGAEQDQADLSATPTPTPGPTSVPDRDGDGVTDSQDACPTQAGSPGLTGCPDGDNDSIADSNDLCPTEPGPQATRGCPDRDGDAIRDADDLCPAQAGQASAGGCPDSDGDGIQNSQDLCPTQAGVASAQGCPDSDGDGIQNSQDQCPTQAGVASAQGCPDSDGDGIRNSLDLCPTVAGQASAQGCPDSDGDGIQNSQDQCPTQAGVASAQGCPDSDGDGIRNSLDLCPTVAGQASAQGCPDSDGDGIQNSQDLCPTVAGVASAQGCPDSDGDGIQNSQDLCPTVAGVASAQGCPDSDGDGIQNSQDLCPTVAGVASAQGCPDSDGDGIQNSQDLCPTVAGVASAQGCPDSDGDGIQNSQDLCPTVAGVASAQGCPDSDGDGIQNSQDQCPTQPGPSATQGCPDQDSDGIRDSDDACPTQPGPSATQGCPDQDGDGIRDSQDACPTQPGPSATQGCPDQDGDGIRDSQDACPTQPGPSATQGCPDQDGDGIRDSQDACPTQAGPSATQGCPDQDGDGIRDSQDACPTQAGPSATQGCPDQDGDGIRDSQDACPTQAGPSATQGCPDQDGDGIRDSDDACPTQAGPSATQGCPDQDGDGIRDSDDACPTQPGPSATQGCPDQDGDGVRDSQDACPSVPGLPGFAGCPDGDGDGVPEPPDACPGQAGPPPSGCPPPPDDDGDGIPNASDACPSVAGLPAYGGCPDADGDGVPEPPDACPGVAGQPPDGCPPPPPEPPPPDPPPGGTLLFPATALLKRRKRRTRTFDEPTGR